MSDSLPTTADLLAVLKRDLDAVLRAELTSPLAQTTGLFSSQLLLDLAARQGARADILAAQLSEMEALVGQGLALSSGEGAYKVQTAFAELPADSDARHAALTGLLETLAPPLAATASGDAEAWLRDVSRLERAAYEEPLAAAQAAERDAAEAIETLKVEVTDAGLTDYLKGRFPDDPDIASSDATKVPGGYSKETFSFTLNHGDGRAEKLMIRRDLPAAPSETKVADEAKLIGHLHALGFPVAEPRWLETDTSVLGTPFLVVSKVDGRAGVQDWQAEPELAASACRSLAELLARLHTTDLEELGFTAEAAALSPQESILAYLEEWEGYWRAKQLRPSPILARAFAWARNNIPAEIERTVLVHADVGFHNTILRDGEIAALVDWEFSHIGDAAEDIGYCRQFVEPIFPWDEFMRIYNENGGPEYRPENARYYEVWRAMRNAVCTSLGMHAFATGANPELKLAFVAVPLYHGYLRDIVVTLDGAE